MERDTSWVKVVASLLAGIVGLAAAPAIASAQDGTVRVSVSSTGEEADNHAWAEDISATGRFVTFSALADNLFPNDTNGFEDIFVRDRDPDGNGVFDEGNEVTTRVSVDSSGLEGDGMSWLAAISSDGRHVVFVSAADNLVASDNNGFIDVFVRDRDPDGNGIFDEGNGVTVRVSVDSTGVEAGSNSFDPSISADGRYVVFNSYADNLVANDWNFSSDVFVFDRDPDGNSVFDEGNGVTTRMSIRADGMEVDGDSLVPRISSNGRHVAFSSNAHTLVPNDTNSSRDVFVHDRDPDGNGIFDEGFGAVARVSVSSSGIEGARGGDLPAISADGRHVAFASDSNNLVSDDRNSRSDEFAHDRDPDGNGIFDEGNGVTTRMSVDSAGKDGGLDSGAGAISADGRIVAFWSDASNFDANDTNRATDVFVRDRDPDGNGIFDEGNGVTTLVSVNDCGFEGDDWSNSPAISADGRYVALTSQAGNLAEDDFNGVSDAFVRDLSSPPAPASWNNYGAGFPGTLGIPDLSASANPVIGTSIKINVGNSLGSWTVGLLLFGMNQDSLRTRQGGTILVDWIIIAPLALQPSGSTWPLDIPDDWTFCRESAFLQSIEFDAGAQYGVSFSAGLELVVGR